VTTAEWGPLAARIDNWWSQPIFDEERSAAYFERLCDYEFDQVEIAFSALLSEGMQYLPSLSVVLAKLEENADPALRFETMWAAVKAALCQENPERFLEPEHPLYLRFYIEQGRIHVLSCVEQSNSYAMYQMRQGWKDLTAEFRAEVRRGRVRKALAARPLVPLEDRAGPPRKLDPSKALPQGAEK
jgi:hypothetical protein